jgi:cell shape-determining protein MreC
MANQTLSQSVSDFRTMSSGITTRLESLSGVGITAADATAMSDYADQLDKLNAEQEELKAQLKAKTEALNTTMKAAKAKNSELTKRLKIAVPQSEWLAFGVMAKR